MPNQIANAREQELFIVKETTAGTLVPPTAASYVIAAGEVPAPNQQPSFTNSSEVRNTRGLRNRFQDKTGAGDWSIPLYVTPSGAAGTAPQEDVLMECLFGTKTVNGGTSVVYSLANTKPSFSMWLKKDHTVFWAKGCTVNSFKVMDETKDGAKMEFSGQFMRTGQAGTDTLDGAAATTDTVISVDDAKKFSVGSFVEFVESGVTYNNTNAGYEITAVSVSGGTVTITPGLETDLDDASTIQGWLPTGTEVGSPIEARTGAVTIDTVAFAHNSFELNISDEVKYLDDEITTDGYPDTYVEDTRSVSGTTSLYFRQEDVKYYYDGQNNTEKAIAFSIGTAAGSILTFDMAVNIFDVPSLENVSPTLALRMNYTSLETNGNDEITATYT